MEYKKKVMLIMIGSFVMIVPKPSNKMKSTTFVMNVKIICFVWSVNN